MVSLLLPIIYTAFISLGLPDSLLGSAWPTMYPELGVPVSCAGILSMIISLGTILSSLQSDRLTRTLGTGRVTAISVGMTAAALFGFSISTQFWMLCLWAIPYGLGAGSVDAALNNYVALMIRMGQIILAVGVAALLIPGPQALALAGLVLVGLGCAPIYPSIIHSTPDHFGADKSQAVIGIQMASAYVGNLTMPPLFGLLANNITPALFPFYLLALLVLMVCMHEQLVRKTRRS